MVKRIVLSFLFCSIAFGSSLQQGVDKLINQVDPAINMGITVVDLNTGQTLYQRNANRLFIPASNMKLFSEASALMILGPDYQFTTNLSTNAKRISKGILQGTLFLHLSGDPSFSTHDLTQLLSSLDSWGVKKINGDVVIVSDTQEINPYGPGWMVDDLKYGYGAPLSPLILDENRLTITINPAHKIDTLALIEVNEQFDHFKINNQVQTRPKTKPCGIDFNVNEQNEISVRGCVNVGQGAIQQRIAIRNPLRYAQLIILNQLKHQGIELQGHVLLGKTHQPRVLLATHYSKPIAQLLADTLKPSDNLYADSLFLHAATKLNGTAVNWPQARILITNFLQKQTHIPLQTAKLSDGSGLSRYDQVTPHQTVLLLQYLYDHFPLAYEFIAALPIAGQDGTLKKRFRKATEQGLIRAKTGTMTGVISLSGYLYTLNGHTLAFAIYINNLPGTHPSISGRYRYLVDAVCRYFLQQKLPWQPVKITTLLAGRFSFQHPTLLQHTQAKKVKWRQLEAALKKAFHGQAVEVIFHDNELVLHDYNHDLHQVLTTLQRLHKEYPFAVILQSKSVLPKNPVLPSLLQINHLLKKNTDLHIWQIRETVS